MDPLPLTDIMDLQSQDQNPCYNWKFSKRIPYYKETPVHAWNWKCKDAINGLNDKVIVFLKKIYFLFIKMNTRNFYALTAYFLWGKDLSLWSSLAVFRDFSWALRAWKYEKLDPK